jgi:hypothetical protein
VKLSESIKLEIPENLVKAAELLKPYTKQNIEEYMIEAIKSDFEAFLGNYGPDMEMDKVPIYLDPTRYAWFTWWYEVLRKRGEVYSIDDFLHYTVLKFIEPFRDTLTCEESARLDQIYNKLEIPDESPLKQEVMQLLAK